jgi:hypothetical protein
VIVPRSPDPSDRPTVGPDSFTSAHRRSIGIALKLFDDLIRSLRADGLDNETLMELEAAAAEMAAVTGAEGPRPKGGELNAKLAQMLVHAMELDSRRLRAYGELLPEAADYLDEQSRRLSELTIRLMDRLRRTGG